MKLVCAFGLFAAFAFVLYGWGWALRRLVRAETRSWPATIASGMAAVVFLGGVLNLARLAYPWALACVAIAGAVLGALALRKNREHREPLSGQSSQSWWTAWLLAVVVLCFVVLTQVPPKAYNFHDDYQKYFGHVVRMLETGTVFGSPLSVIGFDTLGGQAFLHGFAVALLPIRFVNGVDAAFALFLCMMLASRFAGSLPEQLPLTVLCALGVVFINPQYVNISALYTGSFLIMALIDEKGSSPVVTGLLYAALVALKSSYVLFVVLHLVAALWVRGLKWAAAAAAASALFVAPWILVQAPHYAAIFGDRFVAPDNGVRNIDSFNVFSTEPLDFGSTAASYTWLTVAVGVSGAMIAWARRKVDMTAAACFALIPAYLIAVYVSAPRAAGYAHAIRYFAPFAIGVAPAAFGSAGAALSGVAGPRWLRLGAPLLLSTVPVFAFAPSLRDRAQQAIHSGSVLAFSWLAPDPDYIDYSQQVLYGNVRRQVEAAQAAVPAGKEVVVWINAPFDLDYRRNRIVNIEPSEGFVTPWSKLPDAHYFIWEYVGYANMEEADYAGEMAEGPDLMRRVWAARSNMTRRMSELMRRGDKLYDDGAIAVFRD